MLGLAAFAVVIAVVGTWLAAVNGRTGSEPNLLGVAMAIIGLFVLAAVSACSPDAPKSRAAALVASIWFAPGLALMILATLVISNYGFRTCADLPRNYQCVCYYVGLTGSGSKEGDAAAINRQFVALKQTCDPSDAAVLREVEP